MSATNSHADSQWCKAKHCWCSIDTHVQNEAGSVSCSLLLINSAYNTFMNLCIQLPLRLPKMQDQKSLTRHWLSFLSRGCERVSLVFDYKGGQYIRKGQRCTKVDIEWLAVGYLIATSNRNTRKPDQGLELRGVAKPGKMRRLASLSAGLAREEAACQVCG